MAKKRNNKNKRNKSIFLSLNFWIWSIFSLAVFYVIFLYTSSYTAYELYTFQRVEYNYGKEIDKYAKEFNISASYLKALTVLETSGRTDQPSRYEKHIHHRLREVQTGKRKRYESLTKKMVENVSEEALKNLATSWGPFQIMGYKCVQIGIYVHHLRGNEAVFWGAKWINFNYGDLLRDGKYKDAFHFHNTGRYFPKDGKSQTHDPKYVSKGLHYMKYFEK